jgi:DNA-binding NtrC family response regulator
MNNKTHTPKILIVDDDQSIIRALLMTLSRYGEIEAVNSGNKAIELLKGQSYDLILSDQEMVDGTGIDIFNYIRDHNLKTPLILITAFISEELLTLSIKSKLFTMIEKPFTNIQIINEVDVALIPFFKKDSISSN